MKKKQLNLLLGILVVAVWGGIAYRVFAALSEDEPPPLVQVNAPRQRADDFAAETDTASLRLNYRDPFGQSKPAITRDSNRHTVNMVTVAHPVRTAPADISFIKYAGYIRSPSAKNSVVMLMINGQTAPLREGESASGVKLLKNLGDSVRILYQHQVRYIVKPAL